ncbi:DUF3302 domain-containing protein [Rhabdochromatium marinum]|uniref:DUF3302 domain-containing protein n=1 Tax=Rhabdochromatium marinum TaxID=48729 RepID=UPI0019082A4A|nr:DUF3302 domain-containing protein [Rhabdochromatium marinum]MBK1650211.1 hypothetical protein [Rhabdochromatium marinum]
MLMAVSVGLILTCIIVIILFIIFVHTMPGKIARKRGNPQEEAIEILSLLGLLIFPLWMAALVWAYLKPFTLSVALANQAAGTAKSDSESVPDSEPTRDPRPQSVSKRASVAEPNQNSMLASDSKPLPDVAAATAPAERPANPDTQA